MDEAVTEDDFYAGPLRGIFGKLSRQNILQGVQTLILDGLSITAELIREIITDEPYNVRILSIREAKNLNERKLTQVLRYVVRPSRPEGTPKLKGLYVFGPKDPPQGPIKAYSPPAEAANRKLPSRLAQRGPPSFGVMASEGAQIGAEWNQKSQLALSQDLSKDGDGWYQASGRMMRRAPLTEWSETIRACEGIISFDAVLCRGPRHDPITYSANDDEETTILKLEAYLNPTIAIVALGQSGCSTCHTSPEGPVRAGVSPSSQLPLLAPPPLHSSTVKAAQCPTSFGNDPSPPLYIRCEDCLRDRWCERCNKWWCEACYPAIRTSTRTNLQQKELSQDLILSAGGPVGGQKDTDDSIKVHLGLCVEGCLVGQMMAGAGAGGMWG
ncbi:MAG: hypothetical protein M1819_003819 [Sarea resinae]|nr:MAG: hypothetical protein M1819_003819 [Sarea resinae]